MNNEVNGRKPVLHHNIMNAYYHHVIPYSLIESDYRYLKPFTEMYTVGYVKRYG